MIGIKVSEKRRFKRVVFKKPVTFQMSDDRHYGGCLSVDLSLGGFSAYFNDFIPLNTELNLSIELGPTDVFDCKARVAWIKNRRFSDSYQIGFEFNRENTEDNIYQKLNRYLLSNN